MNEEKIKVLLIEDDPGYTRLVREMLTEARGSAFELAHAALLSEGLERLEEGVFDVLLLDLTFPDSRGLETLYRARPFEQKVPVVVLTGLEDEEIAQKALENGAQDYLVKGKISADSLVRVIRYAMVRRSAEETLRQSEEKYRTLFENMLEGFTFCRMVYDDDGNPVDWVYLETNKALEALTGLRNIVGKKVTEIIPGIKETNPELLEIYGRVALTGKSEQFEVRVESLSRDLSIKVFSPMQDCFVAVFENITERKQAEEAQRKSEERYKVVADFTYDWECWIAPDGGYLYVSPSCERITGHSRDEFMNEPELLLRIVHPEDREAFEKHFEEDDSAPRSIAFRIIRPDGSMRWIEQWCQQALDPGGKVLGSRASNRDITDLRVAEEDVRRLSHRLMEEGENVRASIAADLHDDVGQSLNAIKMAFDMQYKKMAGHADDETGERMASISEMLSEAIEKVRNISVELVPVNLADFGLDSALENYLERFARENGAAFEFKTNGTPGRVGLELETALFRIAQEALANVRKHSKANSVAISTSWSESLVSLSVCDDGAGFDVDRTYAAGRAGDHFGLVAMRERARMLKGDFIVESRPGEGTTVTVSVPLERS